VPVRTQTSHLAARAASTTNWGTASRRRQGGTPARTGDAEARVSMTTLKSSRWFVC
jgi:hypothetical protein